VIKFANSLPKEFLQSAKSQEIYHNFLGPLIKKDNITFIDYLSKTDPTAIGIPTAFIAHSWQAKFVDAVEALKKHFGKNTEIDPVIWMDMFCYNHYNKIHHIDPEQRFDAWFPETIKKTIVDIGRTVLILDPWNDPVPFKNSWCWQELVPVRDNENIKLDIVLTDEMEAHFIQSVDLHSTILMNILKHRWRPTVGQEGQGRIADAFKAPLDCYFSAAFRTSLTALYAKEVKARKENLGCTHPEVVKSIRNLANLYSEVRQLEKAELLIKDCLNELHQVQLNGSDERVVLATSMELDLARIYLDHGAEMRASDFYLQCIEGALKYKPVSEVVKQYALIALCELSKLYKDVNLTDDADEAMQLLKAEFNFKQSDYERMTAAANVSPFMLGKMPDWVLECKDSRQFVLAEDLCRKFLKIRQRALGIYDAGALVGLQYLAALHSDQRKYDLAEMLYGECVEKLEKLLGVEDFADFGYLLNKMYLAKVYFEQGKINLSNSLFQECFEIARQRYGEEDSFTQDIKKRIVNK
jgi:tetratricopeptide (TPR) repeat protein